MDAANTKKTWITPLMRELDIRQTAAVNAGPGTDGCDGGCDSCGCTYSAS